jgi:hypothetical protein
MIMQDYANYKPKQVTPVKEMIIQTMLFVGLMSMLILVLLVWSV